MSKNIEHLTEEDIYMIILYALYKLTNDPQYNSISELIYTLDKKSFLNLCSTFGGCTIKIPTLKELEILVKAFLVYKYSVADKSSFIEACKKAGVSSLDKKSVLEVVNQIKGVTEHYVGADT